MARLAQLLRLSLSAACLAAVVQAVPAHASVEHHGYLTMADGTQLRYSVTLPAATGRYPVALNYDGYCAGTGPLTCNDVQMSEDLLSHGYAVLGVSHRGTGCSEGSFELLSPEEAKDGAAAVEWAARQPWSTGRVGMYGDSFPGLTQPPVAALRPKGLAAIAPFQISDDPYRDVAYTGGVPELEFGAFWGLADQPGSGALNLQKAQEPECAQHFAGHEPATTQQNIFLQQVQHPWYDAYWAAKNSEASASRIRVPVLGCASWQDDEVGSRPAYDLFTHIRPSLLWFVGMNGLHGGCELDNSRMRNRVVLFFDHFVKGRDNGFERTPRAQVWHEAHYAVPPVDGAPGLVDLGLDEGLDVVPGWVSSHPSWPPATHAQPFYLRSGGVLGAMPRGAEGADTYVSALPGPVQDDGVVVGQYNALFKQPVVPGSGVAWTSPPLARDLEHLGPASADLWLTSTAADTPLQVTVTEVRPDGQETYVARGWLLASHRTLDRARSTAVRPYQTERQADSAPMVSGVPALLRVEVFPFGHVFRRGSQVRLIVDTPSKTGGWGYVSTAGPALNAVLHDAAHPSRLVLSVLPGGRAVGPLPACDTLLNQPCRPSAY
jgi:predicted acyl esterase